MEAPARLSDFDWVKPDPIAEGGFGAVFHASYKGRDVALKRFSKCDLHDAESDPQRVLNEIAIHMELDHDCIVRVVAPGFFECDETHALYLVTEFCSGGTLMDYLKKPRLGGDGKAAGLPESEAQLLFRQLAEGVAYLHRQRVVHRDIKLKNILLTADMRLKLTDFGVAAMMSSDDDERYSVCGTPATAAPEITPGRSHAASCDIWSMGCVLFAMLTGQSAVVRPTLDTPRTLRPDFELVLGALSPVVQPLLRQMLQTNPDARPTAEQVLTAPWCGVQCAGHQSAPSCVLPPPVNAARQPPAVPIPLVASTYDVVGVSASTASSATIASSCLASTKSDEVDDVLLQLRRDRAAADKEARAKERIDRHAMMSGTGQDGHVGATTVLDIYQSNPDPYCSPSLVSPDRSRHSHSSSMSHEFSASLPSLASSASTTGRKNAQRKLRTISWSGRDLAYRFGHVTPKAALFVMNHVLVAAAKETGRCIQLVCDMENKVWLGSLISNTAFSGFAALCTRLTPSITAEEVSTWIEDVQVQCGALVPSAGGTCAPANGTLVSWALGRPVGVSRLRSRERQVYRWASHVMNTLCANVPKRTLVIGDAVCTVMDNYPMPDFRYAPTSGLCFVHISTRDDTAVVVDNTKSPLTVTSTRATGFTGQSERLPPAYRATLTDAQVALAQCLLQTTRSAASTSHPTTTAP